MSWLKISVFMIFCVIVFAGVAYAQQSLNAGYFIYYNLTVGRGSSIFVGINSSSNVDLVVVPSSEFSSWEQGNPVYEVYNKSVGTGIYEIGAEPGKYTVIFYAADGVVIYAGATPFNTTDARIISPGGTHTYFFGLNNYSVVNITVLSDSGFRQDHTVVNVSGQPVYLNGSANLEFLNFTLNRGNQSVYLSSEFPETVLLGISNTSTLINPFEYVSNYSNPIGVASYGLYDKQGHMFAYQINTSGVVGVANITSMYANNTGLLQNGSEFGDGLQLNVEMQTKTNGREQVFWLQNVADFNTSSDRFYLVDNIWNNTLPYASVASGSLYGEGNLSVCSDCFGQQFYAYSYPVGFIDYSLPLKLKLVVTENNTYNGTVVSFGYQIMKNGVAGLQPMIYYDRVVFRGYHNSSILVSPFFLTPSGANLTGNYYDAEFVFGGSSNGAEAKFYRMGALLWLYYYSQGRLVPFPSAFAFVLDTKETAGGLMVAASKNGDGAFVTVGKLNPYVQMFSSNEINSSAQYISNSSTYTAPATTAAYVINPGGAVSFNLGQIGLQLQVILQYLVYLIVVLAVFVVLRLVLRKR